MSEQAIVGKRFTIVVPKSVRERLGLKEGQRVTMRVKDGRLLVEPLPSDPYRTLERLVGEPYSEPSDEMKAERWVKKHASH